MEPFEYLIILAGLAIFYMHKLKKLSKHMSPAGIIFYATLKLLALLITPFLSLVVTSNVLGLDGSSVWLIVAITFVVTLIVITVFEDKKIGIIDEVIKQAEDDFYK